MTLLQADALRIPLADQSVHCCVTSPPYWGLRDYGVPGQLGLEPTPAEYVANMVTVFREVWRVLRDDGSCWLNLGDTYAANRGQQVGQTKDQSRIKRNGGSFYKNDVTVPDGLKPKDLCGIPWRVAFALQDDGWYLRSDIIWHKPNCMPESVTDRPTKAHEYLFLMTKSARYFYDVDAIREPLKPKTFTTFGTKHRAQGNDKLGMVKSDNWGRTVTERRPKLSADGSISGSNKRTVWTVPTAPYSGAHFAVFPPKLIEPCIKAGTSERGVCPECGAPWERVTEKPIPPAELFTSTATPDDPLVNRGFRDGGKKRGSGQKYQNWLNENPTITTGWQPACTCGRDTTQRALVLDPFGGSGTTKQVAENLGRRAVCMDLSRDYLGLARQRTTTEFGGRSQHIAEQPAADLGPLFTA